MGFLLLGKFLLLLLALLFVSVVVVVVDVKVAGNGCLRLLIMAAAVQLQSHFAKQQ